jgi:hypothetical protein
VFGEIFLGIVKFFSGGGFGIWWLIDLFSIRTRVYQSNKSIAHQLFQAIKANS